MGVLEVDYLVVGAGASGMAFVDSLIAESDAEVALVDRRHGPGGHWNDDYPFVRPNGFTPEADIRNYARAWGTTQRAVASWMAEPDVNDWLGGCRLGPLGNAGEHLADPAAMDSLMRMLASQPQAVDNLERLAAEPPAS